MIVITRPLTSIRSITAGVLLSVSCLLAPAAAAQPSFEAICSTDASFLVRGKYYGTPTRTLYRYEAPASGTEAAADVLGVIDAPVDGVVLYDGWLYGIDRSNGNVVRVSSDGTVLSSTPVSGMPLEKPVHSGAVDAEAGIYYVNFSRSSRIYTLDLQALSTDADALPLSIGGNRFQLASADLALYSGFLYGYDYRKGKGVRINAKTGEVALFDVAGLPVQKYESAWVNSAGQLVLSQDTDVYEVDITGLDWAVSRTVTLPGELSGRSGDGTACPVTPLPTFESVCSVDPNAAIVMRAGSGSDPTRTLYRYTPPATGSLGVADTLGIIDAKINAVGLYGGYLYGIGREDADLYQVASDGTIVAQTSVPGLVLPAQGTYLSGTTDVETGLYYVNSIRSSDVFVVDLKNIAAGATQLPVTLDGIPFVPRAADLALYDGYLYGFSRTESKGVRIKVLTGAAEVFPVTGGIPTDTGYGSAWVNPDGELVLNRGDAVYEIDISGATWTVTRSLTVPGFVGGVQDATACPVVAPPRPKTFNCSGNPDASFVTGSQATDGSRELYRYTADVDNNRAELDLLGEIAAPINAIGLYADTLYGYHRYTGRLLQVNADGAIVDSIAVPGLPIDKGRAYIAGTVDPATGMHYAFARYFDKAYAVDLDDVAAGATKIPFLLNGEKTVLNFGDFAFSGGFLYGYDDLLQRGFKLDVATGAITLVPVSIPNQLYPAAWFGLDGTLFLYKTAAETYEINVSDDAGWTVEQTFTGLMALSGQRDGATCGSGAPTRQASSGTYGSEERLGLSDVPATVSLGAPYPNPARGQARIALGLPEAGRAKASVYDVMGRRVAVVFDADAEAGWTDVTVETSALAAGTYIVRLQAADGVTTSKLVVVD